jgi:hypothetical protein
MNLAGMGWKAMLLAVQSARNAGQAPSLYLFRVEQYHRRIEAREVQKIPVRKLLP